MAKAVAITPDSNHSGVPRLAGFSIREDSSAAAHIRLRRNGVVGGDIIWELALAADESASIIFPKNESIHCGAGCYVEEVSGSVTGVLFTP